MKRKNETNILITIINKFLFCTVIFLVAAIISKTNPTYKEKITNYLYNQSFNFSTIRNIYNKYLGGISPIKKDEAVFNEKLKYNNITSYKEGAKLEVEKNYLVPNQEKGIVVFVGNKENYNNSIIIENDNGIDILYGNICNTNLKLYDTIEKNTYIGESCDNYIYIAYNKGNKVLDYKNYLS